MSSFCACSRVFVQALAYLIGFIPTVIVAETGPCCITPNWAEIDTPALLRKSAVDPIANAPSIDKIFFNSPTSALSEPSTSTPNDTDPADCMVSRLSTIRGTDFDSESKIWLARTSPSVSFAYDFISTTRSEKLLREANALTCLSLRRRGEIASSNRRFCADNSAVCFSRPAASLWASLARVFNSASSSSCRSLMIFPVMRAPAPVNTVSEIKTTEPQSKIDFKVSTSHIKAFFDEMFIPTCAGAGLLGLVGFIAASVYGYRDISRKIKQQGSRAKT